MSRSCIGDFAAIVAARVRDTQTADGYSGAGGRSVATTPRRWTRPVLAAAGAVLTALIVANPAAASGEAEGTLFEQHGETLQGTTVDRAFFIATDHGNARLSEAQPERLIGQTVAIADSRATEPGLQGQVRAVHPGEHLVAAPPPGPQTVLVLILTTPDDPTPASTDQKAVREVMFTGATSVAAYYAQQSDGTTTLTGRVNSAGDVLGPIAVSTPMTGCPTGAIADEADERALAMGYTPTSYDHVVYVLPPNGECGFGGLGELPGRRSWSNGYLVTSVFAHELGHNMGAGHANLLSCSDAEGAPTPYSANCTSAEYGDPFDVMGSSTALMSAFHRHQIGQLPEGEIIRLHQSQATPVASSEDFLSPGPRLVLVPIKHPHLAVSEYFALDARAPLAPFDAWSTGDPVTTGLTIRKISEAEFPTLQTQLINMHPAAPVTDSALQPGETFSDPLDGISVTAGSSELGGLAATVAMPTLTDDVPPSPPLWLFLSIDTAGTHLAWTSATDDVAVDHYRILRNGAELGTARGLRFDDPKVPLSTVTYGVITVDTSGNESSPTTATIQLSSTGGGVQSFTSSRPKISIANGVRRDRHRHLLVGIACQAAAHSQCAGILRISTVTSGKRRQLGSARYKVPAGTTVKVPVHVAGGLAYLTRRARPTVHVVATVSGGPTVNATCRLLPARRH